MIKRVFLCYLLLLSHLLSAPVIANNHDGNFKNNKIEISDKQKRAFLLGTNLLENHHYLHYSLAQLSSDIHDNYIKFLDSEHSYFLQKDIDLFEKERYFLSNAISKDDLSIPFNIYKRYYDIANAHLQWILQRLESDFDLNRKDSITYPAFGKENQHPYPKTAAEREQYQEKILTDQIINLMLMGKTKEKAIAILKDRYSNSMKRLHQTNEDDVFEVYMNTIANRFDPHSEYLSYRASENFDIDMSLTLEGIGANLMHKEDKIVIASLIAGGPAANSGQIKVKDKIIGVAQGKKGKMVDVVGWRLDEAVKIIRGKKGSWVRLAIEPANDVGSMREVLLKRDTINLEDRAAYAIVETIGHAQHRIGVINLPSFYVDFQAMIAEKKNYRSTARDVKKLLKQLQKQKVDAVVIDLRGNGGGSLSEAINTVSLFIDDGPVVMISDADGEISVRENTIEGKEYSGPLAVLIDHNSASASEIFAAAIKDYRRGIIIGNNSFGKGTVQTIVPLDQFVSYDNAQLGDIKLTVSMFHRVNGDSTQIKGVRPDIEFPDEFGLDIVGELSEKYALPFKKIPAAKYLSDNDISDTLITSLRDKYRQRLQAPGALQRYSQYLAKLKERSERTVLSLNLEQRTKEHRTWKSYKESYELAQAKDIPELISDKKTKDRIAESNLIRGEDSEEERFVPDVLLFESLQIVEDWLQQRRTTPLISLQPAA